MQFNTRPLRECGRGGKQCEDQVCEHGGVVDGFKS